MFDAASDLALLRQPTGWRFDSPLWPLLWLLPLFAGAALFVSPAMHTQNMITMEMTIRAGGMHPTQGEAFLPWIRGFITFTAILLPTGGVLISCYLAWSPEQLWRRILLFCLLVTLLFGCYLAGTWLKEPLDSLRRPRRLADPYYFGVVPSLFGDQVSEVLTLKATLCTFPCIALAMQLPFWSLRMLFGCRLERAGNEPVMRNSARGFSILDLLLYTAIVAGSISLLQLGTRLLPKPYDRHLWSQTTYSAAFFLVTAFVVGVPAAFLFLRKLRLPAAWGVAMAVIVTFILILLAIGLQQPTTLSKVDRWETLSISCLLPITYLGVLCWGMTLLRVHGWRLVAGNRSESLVQL